MKRFLPFFFLIILPTFLSSKNITLVSDPGTMDLTPIYACDNQDVTANYGYNSTLDPGDVLQFILHDEVNTLGNVFAIKNQPVFSYVSGMNYGTFYFISAVAGMDDGSGNVDLTDPDLVISDGTPIQFAQPQLWTVEGEICDGGIFEYEGYEYDMPGFYILQGTDSTGCAVTVEITVNAAAPLNLQVNLSTDVVTCWGGAGASTNLNGPDYVYKWSRQSWQGNLDTFSTSSSIITWQEGEHYVEVTDINTGCQSIDTFMIYADYYPPFVNLQASGSLNCNNTSVTLESIGGWGNYFYEWLGPNGNISSGFGSTLTVTEPGNYTLIVIDFNNGCESWESITVVEDNTSINVITEDEQFLSCFNSFSVTLAAEMNTLISNAQFNWTGPSFFTSNILNPTVTIPGTYILNSVNSSSGCADLDTIIVSEASVLPAINLTEANCGLSDGAIGAYVPDIADPSILSYNWSTGETTDSIENLATGEYFVTVTGGSCEHTRTVNMTETVVCRVKIRGTVYLDHDNQDCILDATTQKLEGRMICLYSGATGKKIYTFTDSNGDYEFIVDPGDYLIRLVKNYNFIKLCPTGYWQILNLPTPGQISEDNDFYDRMRIGQDFAVSAANTNVRPLFNNWFTVSYCNNSDNLGSGTVSFTHDDRLENLIPVLGNEYASYDPATQTATWDFLNLQPLECQKIKFKAFVTDTVAVGDEVTNEVNILPIASDYNPVDNSFIWTKAATLSFDPNDKQEFSGETNFGGALYNPEDSILYYQIQFQNKGTDTAFTVVVKDVLDDDLDVTSIRRGVSTHDYEMKFEGSNTLIFEFKDIQLPHEAIDTLGSQGFITFSIKQKPDLPLGTEIRNSAAIYFDFNAPIITNQVINILEAEYLSIEGEIRTEEGDEVEDVNVLLNGDASESVITNQTGEFVFEDLAKNGVFDLDFEKDINPLNGVTTHDIYKINQHILGINYLDSPYKILAADANGSSTITALDGIHIRNLILQNTTAFPNSDSWRFVDADYSFLNVTQPWDMMPVNGLFSFQNLTDNQKVDVIGIKVGDVNNSADANNLMAVETRDKIGDIFFYVDNQGVSVGEEIAIDFTTRDFKEVTSYQYTFDFNIDQLSYIGFEAGALDKMTEDNLGFKFLENGQITMAWAAFASQDIKDDEVLFTLKFKAQKRGMLNDMMEINSTKIEALAYDKEENIYDVKLLFKDTDGLPKVDNGFQVKVTPTLTKDHVNLQFILEKEEGVNVLLFNTYGAQIHEFDFGKKQEGTHLEKISLKDFPKGVYYIFVKTKRGSALERIVKI